MFIKRRIKAMLPTRSQSRFSVHMFLLGVFGLGLSSAVSAQPVQTFYASYGQSDPLPESSLSARAAAMGSAFTAVADDASALFSNPAGLATLSRGEIGILSALGWVNSFQESVLLGLPLGAGQGIAVSGSYLGYGTLDGRDEIGSLTSSYGANQWDGQAGGGIKIDENFYGGAGLHYSLQMIADNSYFSWTPDFGVLFKPFESWKLGLDYALPLGGSSGTPWVSTLRIGASWNCPLDSSAGFLAALGYSLESDSFQALQAGTEFSFGKKFFLRAGYQAPLQDNGGGGNSGLSLGAGLKLAGLALDYAYLPGGELGDTNQFSLIYPFSLEAPPTPASTPSVAPPPATPQPAAETTGSNNLTVRFNIPADFQTQGETMEAQGRPEEAISLYQQALQQDPQNIPAWMDLGKLYFKLKQKDKAVPCFEKILEIQPDNQALKDWLEEYKTKGP